MALMHLQYQIVPPDWDCAENMDMECRYLLLETPLSCNSPVTEPEQGARQNSPGSGVSVQSGVSTVTHPCHTLWHCVMCHDIVSCPAECGSVCLCCWKWEANCLSFYNRTNESSSTSLICLIFPEYRPTESVLFKIFLNISNSQYLTVRFSTTIL